MKFHKILEMQKALDTAIMSAHNINHKEVREKRIVALLVEIGEFANEYAPFKYWKKNKVVDRAKLIEEFVDGIHFFASLALDLGFDIKRPEIHSYIVSEDKSVQLLETFNAVAALKYKFDEEQLTKAFGIYMGNARLLEITNEEIEDFYIEKNKENFDRIARGY